MACAYSALWGRALCSFTQLCGARLSGSQGQRLALLVRNCLKIWRWYTFSSMVPDVMSRYTVTSLCCTHRQTSDHSGSLVCACGPSFRFHGSGCNRLSADLMHASLCAFKLEF